MTADIGEGLSRSSTRGRLTLIAVTLGSGVAILDSTVVNVALKTIGKDLDASLAELQWTVNGYTLSLASLILVAGSLGDRLGRKRIYLIGMVWFGIASAMCAVAQSPIQLVLFRVLQGVGGALLTPGALAIIQSSFRREDRAPAIGWWAGMSGIAAAIGPFVGGWLIDNASWRWVFAINVPLCFIVVFMTLRWAPESVDTEMEHRFDFTGAGLTVAGLGLLTYCLTGLGTAGMTTTLLTALLSLAAWVAFVMRQQRTAAPLVPLSLFASRVFSAANGMTLLVYGALSAVFLMLVLQLQVVVGYSALEAGVATLPVTIFLMFLSSRLAALSSRIGPRLPMTVGPLLCALGVLLLAYVDKDSGYWLGVLPGVVTFGLGLAALVSPLTATVLAAAPDRHAGVASGVNNAVARAGSLLAVAAIPAIAGLSGDDYANPVTLSAGYHTAQLISAVLLAGGGIVSWFGLAGHNPKITDAVAVT